MPPPSETGLEILSTVLIRAHVRFLPFRTSPLPPTHTRTHTLNCLNCSVSGSFVALQKWKCRCICERRKCVILGGKRERASSGGQAYNVTIWMKDH